MILKRRTWCINAFLWCRWHGTCGVFVNTLEGRLLRALGRGHTLLFKVPFLSIC